jgi:hypothetical protein
MTVGRIFGIILFSSIAATSTTVAGSITKGTGIRPGHLPPTSGAGIEPGRAPPTNGAGIEPGHPVPTSGLAGARHARPQAPIVIGRSVSIRHKTKLHHIKMKPLESIETSVSADNSR